MDGWVGGWVFTVGGLGAGDGAWQGYILEIGWALGFTQVLRGSIRGGPRVIGGLRELGTRQQFVGGLPSQIQHLMALSVFQKSLPQRTNYRFQNVYLREVNSFVQLMYKCWLIMKGESSYCYKSDNWWVSVLSKKFLCEWFSVIIEAHLDIRCVCIEAHL